MFSDTYAKSEPRPLLDLETREIPKTVAEYKNAVTRLVRFLAIVAMHIITAYYAPR